VQIGDDIRITVVRVHGNRVVLGIDAPASVRVLRGELSFDFEEATDGSGTIEPSSKRGSAMSAA
jgi:carbon storage regulator CsrA